MIKNVKEQYRGKLSRSILHPIGVITYSLLYGKLPFNGKKHVELFKAIISGKYSFDESINISDDAKNFIRGLLVTDPSRRRSAEEALRCPWISSNNQLLLRENSLMRTTQKLRLFNARLKLKSVVFAIHSVVLMNKFKG